MEAGLLTSCREALKQPLPWPEAPLPDFPTIEGHLEGPGHVGARLGQLFQKQVWL
jgi:hypothetical protein